MGEFVAYVREELARVGREGWQESLEKALVKLPPTQIMRPAVARTEEESAAGDV